MRAADHEGPRGWKAWRVPLPAAEMERIGALGTWLLYVPGVHAFWSYWSVSLAHLRELPNMPSPVLSFPGATHELLVHALDPNHAPNPDDAMTFKFLTPTDVVEQWSGTDDAQALELVDLLAKACAHGWLCPDSDFRYMWGPTIASTLQHMLTGGHGPQEGGIQA